MTESSAPGIRRRQLAIRLTALRNATGMSHAKVSEWTGLSQSVISKIENARQPIQIKHVRLLAQCYNVSSPELDGLLRMTMESNERGLLVAHSDTAPDFARQYFELEAYAAELWVYEPGVAFGPFQHELYTEALTLDENPNATPDDVAARVALRAARRKMLIGRANPPTVRLVIDEAVVRRCRGDAEVMKSQIDFLCELSLQPNVDLRLVPFSNPHPSVGMGFTVIRFDDHPPGMDVVYIEHIRSATYLEKPTDLARYVEAFERISSAAMPPEATRQMLSTLGTHTWEQPREGQG